jgi:putative FmdB family regulatory protein
MPIFEYLCQECNHRFEMLVHGSTVPICPSCKGSKLVKQFSTFGVGTTADGAASSALAPCAACGDPRGPGACAMN